MAISKKPKPPIHCWQHDGLTPARQRACWAEGRRGRPPRDAIRTQAAAASPHKPHPFGTVPRP